MAETADNDWVQGLKPSDRAAVRTLGLTDNTPHHKSRTKILNPDWRRIVYEHCTSAVTLNKNLLARHLGISRRTLETRMRKVGDELGEAILNARAWLSYKLAEPMLRRALADESADSDALRLKLLARVDPENFNDSLIAARASKGPAVVVNNDNRSLTFGKPLSFDQWMAKVAQGAIPGVSAPAAIEDKRGE